MSHGTPVNVSATILRSPMEVYSFWRDWSNLPRFSRHLKSVVETIPGQTQWVSEGPTGDVSWEARTIDDIPGERLSWESLKGATVANGGVVEFQEAPGGRGTELRVHLEYDAPGGSLGIFIAKLTGNDAEQEVAETVRRVKSILECGEIPVVEGQPSNIMRKESLPGDESKKVGVR